MKLWLSCLVALSFGSATLLAGNRAHAEDEVSVPNPARPERSVAPPPARRAYAPLPGADGVYGRFDGSLALGVGLGAELESGEARGALKLSALYLWTAGVYARYSDAFGTADERPTRVVSLGIDARPLFLPRFALDLEHGPALLDLTLDSLALNAGAYFAEPGGGAFGDERGFEAGLGFGVPLFAEAAGPWLQAQAERRFADRGDDAWLFTLSVAYHASAWTTAAE